MHIEPPLETQDRSRYHRPRLPLFRERGEYTRSRPTNAASRPVIDARQHYVSVPTYDLPSICDLLMFRLGRRSDDGLWR